MSARDKLLSFTQPQLVPKQIKALGDDPVYIKKLTMAEARKLHQASEKKDIKATGDMMAKSICDADGEAMLTSAQVDQLASDVATDLMQAILEANGMTKPPESEGNVE